MAKTKPAKHTRGRRTLYKAEMCDLVERLCFLGLKDEELAHSLKITRQTLDNWKRRYPEFFASIKKGREEADGNVARALYFRAIGYEHPEDKVFLFKGNPVVVPTIKHYPPDPLAAFFWLKNRRPDKWMDKPVPKPDGKEQELFVKALDQAVGLWDTPKPEENE